MGKEQIEMTPRLRDVADEVKDRLRALEEQDAESRRKARAADRKAGEIEQRLPGMKRELEKLTAEVLELQSSIRAKRQAEADELLAKPKEDLRAGKISVIAFSEELTAAREKAAAIVSAVDEQVETAVAVCREKGLAILKLEHELWAAKADFYYLSGHPSEVAIGEIEKTIRELSLTRQGFASRFMGAQGELSKAKDKLDRAQGRAMTAGWAADNFSIETVRRIPLDPVIPAKYLPTFAGLLAEVEANEKRRAEKKQGPGLYFISLTYRSGVDAPWDWLCRNDGSPIVMSKAGRNPAPTSIITMDSMPPKGKVKGG